MDLFMQLGIDGSYIVIGLLCGILILLILYIVLLKKFSGFRKRYDKFMEGADGKNLESSILKKFSEIDMLKDDTRKNREKITSLSQNLMTVYQKCAISKFDAFKEMGGKLSFVLCMLTKENDGFILTSMHSSSEGCYTYIKEIIKGESYVILGEEEKKVLQEAKNVGKESN